MRFTKSETPPLRQVNTRLSDADLAALQERVAAEQSTIGATVRRAVLAYVEQTNAGEIASPALNTEPAQAEGVPQA